MTTQMGEQTSCNFRANIGRNRTQSLAFGRDTKAGNAWASFIEEKRGRFRFALIGGCCTGMLRVAN